jgi:CPA2 family monovalent cation:H+ antiporter-2
MPHDSALIVTLAGAFGLAFVMGMLATRLKLPPLVGYLAAGVIIGPFTPGYVADSGLASQLAEVGVILLMFGVGLHFSIKDLLAVRRIAVPGAILRIVIVTLATAAATLLWGWSFGSGIVFGIALSVASTVVVLKALDELGLIDSSDGRIAVGWLVVEDLAMVLVLVLLPPLAPVLGGHAAAAVGSTLGLGAQIGITLLKVAAFVVLMLYVGTRAVPWLLGVVARTGSRELFTLAVLAVALGIGVGAAALFGVSFALGAFFAGVVIAESDLSHQAAADALPLQDAFAVLFFVSVGMLFDYGVLVRDPLRILEVLVVVIVIKGLVTFAIVRLFGRPIRSTLVLSTSLAQIGEFSFILAGLGVTLGIMQEEARSLILAGAILSITLNPLMMYAGERVQLWLEARPHLLERLEPPHPPVDDDHAKSGAGLHMHVVLIGYGRVGRRIGDAMMRSGIPFIAVDRDRVAIDNLRAKGVPAIYGDAARPGILDHVNLVSARLLVITSPDLYQARRVVELARKIKPHVHIVVRTHSEAAQSHFEGVGVDRAFMGERELALSMAHYAMMYMGKSDDEADETVDAMRRHTSMGINIKDLGPRI